MKREKMLHNIKSRIFAMRERFCMKTKSKTSGIQCFVFACHFQLKWLTSQDQKKVSASKLEHNFISIATIFISNFLPFKQKYVAVSMFNVKAFHLMLLIHQSEQTAVEMRGLNMMLFITFLWLILNWFEAYHFIRLILNGIRRKTQFQRNANIE